MLPRVHQRDACGFEVRDIASDDRHAMNQCGRGDQGVAFGARVGNVKLCTPLHHGRIDRQDTAFEPSENLMIDPSTQDSTLRRVLARDQQRPKFDFENRDGGDKEARRGDRVPPGRRRCDQL